MMMLLHSVWSGGEGAAGRRRSLIALGALLALVGSVLFWAPESRAQNESPPVAIATVGVPSGDPPTATLTGTGSFDPGDDTALTYMWEVVTESYSWLTLATPAAGTTTFPVPSATLAARYGQSIEFRLTVTDGDGATDSATVTFNVNQGPTADIAVSAMLADPANPDVAGHDDNGNGLTDEIAELFPLDGVIDGPGENGNADNEWDIAEGALITLDGSGSSDPNGSLGDAAHDWTRVYVTPGTAYDGDPGASLPDTTADMKMISTDGGDTDTEKTMLALSAAAGGDVTGQPAPLFYVYYRLTVTDSGGATGSAVVRLVVHDRPADPVVATLVASVTDEAAAQGSAIAEAGAGRYVVAPGSSVVLTATPSDADQADDDLPAVSWEGAQATGPGAVTATFQAPASAEQGQEFTVTATATDVTGRTGSSSVVLVVASNTKPEAVAPGDPVTGGAYSVITVNDGSNGGDVVGGRGTGRVALRGIGFDADGDTLSYSWAEQRLSTTAADCPDGSTFTVDATGDGGAADSCPVAVEPPAVARIAIDMDTAASASFAVPEIKDMDATTAVDHDGDSNTDAVQALVIPIAFTVTDQWGVTAATPSSC